MPTTLHHGDAFTILRNLDTATVHAVVADPPYNSGGTTTTTRTSATTRSKYVSSDSGNQSLPDFPGDNRDQRSFTAWCTLWLTECLRVTRPGGSALVFTDWRQLPATSDALQAAGWLWRGVIPWYKTLARPQRGRFTNQCEYVLWGSNGPLDAADHPVYLPGFYQANAPRKRQHITQKPLEVLRAMVRIAPPGGVVLDPFTGSGTTGVAAVLEGRDFVGIELSDTYYELASKRIAEAEADATAT